MNPTNKQTSKNQKGLPRPPKNKGKGANNARQKTKPKKNRTVKMRENSFLSRIPCKECFDPLQSSELYLKGLFDPAVHRGRGMAFGSTNTALADFVMSFELPVTIGSSIVLLICPELIFSFNGVVYGSPGAAISGTTSVNITDTVAYTSVSTQMVPIPIVDVEEFRVSCCELKVVPDSNDLNKGGWYDITYVDTVSAGAITRGAGGSAEWLGPITYNGLIQLPIRRKFLGDQEAVAHWFPNSDEIYLQSIDSVYTAAVANNISTSGLMVCLNAPTTNAVSYNIELRFCMEYVPADAVKSLVEKALPMVHPLAEYYMNLFVATNWDPFVISERKEWEAVVVNGYRGSKIVGPFDGFSVANRGIQNKFRQDLLALEPTKRALTISRMAGY